MFGLGWQELVIVLVIIMIIFGAGKLPEVAKSLGQGVKEFKQESARRTDSLAAASRVRVAIASMPSRQRSRRRSAPTRSSRIPARAAVRISTPRAGRSAPLVFLAALNCAAGTREALHDPRRRFHPGPHRDGRARRALADERVKPPAPSAKSQAGRAVREVVETLLLAALIFFLVRLVVLNFRVDGESMLPNLDDGQMLLVNRNAYQYFDFGGKRYYPFDPPERGDVIVFDPPTGSDKPYIKRIIGLPGEEVTFGDGNVFIDGELLEEDYIEERTRCGGRVR